MPSISISLQYGKLIRQKPYQIDTVIAKTTFQSSDLLLALHQMTLKHTLINNNTFLVLKKRPPVIILMAKVTMIADTMITQ